MKQWWQRYKKALALSRWPVMTPDELRIIEQQKKIKRLYGK